MTIHLPDGGDERITRGEATSELGGTLLTPDPVIDTAVSDMDPGNYSGGLGGTVTNTGQTGDGHTLHGIPEPDAAEFWKVGDKLYVVYYVPESDPPIPMAWETDQEELQTIVGPGQEITYSKTISQQEADSLGMTTWGKATELANTTEHPFDAYMSLIEDQAAVRPWLRDAEVLELIAQATLEGRAVTEAEFQQTEWYRSKNARERQWLLTYESDPKTAQQQLDDWRYEVEEMLFQSGVNEAPQEMVNYMSSQYVMGHWSRTHLERQIKAVSDPNLGYEVDAGLLEAVGGDISGIGTNQKYEDSVRALAERWLGPQFGQWSDADVSRWASRFRESPDGQAELEAELRRQRLALFPEYADPTLTYEDIAMPWRSKVQQIWGQTADETDPIFNRVIRMNDATEAGKLLTQEGLKRGIRQVEQDAQAAMDRAFGDNAGVISAGR